MRVQFLDFYPNFNKTNNVILDHLRVNYTVEVVNSKPDLVICSIFGRSSIILDVPKILVVGECIHKDHWSLKQKGIILVITTTRLDIPESLYYPWGNWYHAVNKLYKQLTPNKTRFCAFVISNPRCQMRNQIFQSLCKYKKVDSAGRVLNNVGYQAPGALNDKQGHGENLEFIRWLSQYKFYICCENQSYPGYHTEKIINAYLANCVPIYWGAETIFDLHTRDSMVYVTNIVEAIKEVERLDKDDEAYKRKQLANPFVIDINSSESPYNYESHTNRIKDSVSRHMNI